MIRIKPKIHSVQLGDQIIYMDEILTVLKIDNESDTFALSKDSIISNSFYDVSQPILVKVVKMEDCYYVWGANKDLDNKYEEEISMSHKVVEVIRGGQKNPAKLTSGDLYDSIINVYDETNKLIHTVPYVNTDFSTGYKGGILAEGEYAAIQFNRKDGKPALSLYKVDQIDNAKIKTRDDLTVDYMTLPSLVPNPNQNNRPEIQYILIHMGGTINSDYSHGCITVMGDLQLTFMANFAKNEIVKVIIKRDPEWIAPDVYSKTI